MDMGKRIKQLRQEKGLTQEELGKYIGVKKAAIMKYEKGNVQNMKRSSIETLSKLFGVSPSYLMCLDEPNTVELGNPVVSIPLLGSVRAGYNHLAQETWISTIRVSSDIITNDKSEYFALEVKGDSMANTFLEGDIVIVHKQSDCDNNDFAIVIINGEEGTLKMVKKTSFGIILQPLNPAYEPVAYTNEEIETTPVQIVGVVVRLERDLKKMK